MTGPGLPPTPLTVLFDALQIRAARHTLEVIRIDIARRMQLGPQRQVPPPAKGVADDLDELQLRSEKLRPGARHHSYRLGDSPETANSPLDPYELRVPITPLSTA